MYFNHPSKSDERDRPEREASQLEIQGGGLDARIAAIGRKQATDHEEN